MRNNNDQQLNSHVENFTTNDCLSYPLAKYRDAPSSWNLESPDDEQSIFDSMNQNIKMKTHKYCSQTEFKMQKKYQKYTKFGPITYASKLIIRMKNVSNFKQTIERCQNLQKVPVGISLSAINAAGFTYIPDSNAIRCNKCRLTITDWESNTNLFSLHANKNPNCEYVKEIRTTKELNLLSTYNGTTTSIFPYSIESEKPNKRQRLNSSTKVVPIPTLKEAEPMKQARNHTFSHWPSRTSVSASQLINAGFFSCSVGDRVMCIYCNLILQQWKPHIDDPWEIHTKLQPKCPYVVHKLLNREAVSLSIINQNAETDRVMEPTASNSFHSHEIVRAVACHGHYAEIPKRYQSFSTWPTEAGPPVDDLVRAGFFYTRIATVVTCFFCNGSLQNWSAKDNPIIEHARWFPYCGYAKQLCGDDLYRKIQESKRNAQERHKLAQGPDNVTNNTQKLQIADDSTLSRFVAARMDLPVSQKLLKRNFSVSVIKRSWEDQLRFKLNDFASDCDLMMACYILQKQINCIQGKKENIIVPSLKMRQLRNALQSEITAAQSSRSPVVTSMANSSSNNSDVDMTSASQSSTDRPKSGNTSDQVTDATEPSSQGSTVNPPPPMDTSDTNSKNICALCMEEEKCLACIPCGHLSTCVPCGYSMQNCPICRQKIDSYVRVYI